MKRSLNSGRIILDSEATEKMTEMMTALQKESGHLKLNSSKLASWIVNYFYSSSFQKVKSNIVCSFFNKRAFLRDIILSTKSEDEILEAISKSLGKASGLLPREKSFQNARKVVGEKAAKSAPEAQKSGSKNTDFLEEFHS